MSYKARMRMLRKKRNKSKESIMNFRPSMNSLRRSMKCNKNQEGLRLNNSERV